MIPRIGVTVSLAALVASVAGRSAAQADTSRATLWDHTLHISALVGESFATGQWRNSFSAGDYGAISMAWPVSHGSSIWVEGQFNGQSQLMTNVVQSAFQATGGGASIYSLTLNLVLSPRDLLFGRVTPYVLGGGGGYSRQVELDDFAGTAACSPYLGFCGVYGQPAVRTRTQNVLGWDAGGGFRMRLESLWVVVEARRNVASTRYGGTSFVPISVGVAW